MNKLDTQLLGVYLIVVISATLSLILLNELWIIGYEIVMLICLGFYLLHIRDRLRWFTKSQEGEE